MVEHIQKSCGHSLINMVSLPGGDTSMSYKGILSDGSYIFIKCHDRSELLFAEAEGLRWLKNTHTIFTPEILCVSEENAEKGYLVLEWIEPGNPGLPDWENLGYALASLHRVTSIQFGWHRNNYLGTLSQMNTHYTNWGNFFVECRLEHLLKKCIERDLLPMSLINKLQKIFLRIPNILQTQEPACAVHGDLWSGNRIFTQFGEPYFIDPAPYWGNREIDLAMMDLFGGFHPRAYAAYSESYPLEPGWEERRSILQLYFLLAHTLLHGSTWLTTLEATLLEVNY